MKSIVPTPSTCFLTSLIFLFVGLVMVTDTGVFRKRLDADGRVMLLPNGRPVIEVDQWASFWNGWPSNLPLVAAILFLFLGVVLWFRSRIKEKVPM